MHQGSSYRALPVCLSVSATASEWTAIASSLAFVTFWLGMSFA